MNKVQFTILGDPVAKGRSKHRTITTRDGRQFNQEYTPAKTRNYEQTVRLEYERQVGQCFPADAALAMEIAIYKRIPKGMTKRNRERVAAKELRPGKKPDVSNVIKSVEDGLNGVAYHDDNQIVDQRGIEWYDETPRVEVQISVIGTRG